MILHAHTTQYTVLMKKIRSFQQGQVEMDQQYLPQKGEVDLLCACLPSENFGAIAQDTDFQNSSVAIFTSYCDYFRPLFFVLDADESFVGSSDALKMTLARLVGIGYQVSFDLMQVGCYGAPQDQTR